MKSINFIKSPSDNLIVRSITDARLDKMETQGKALEKLFETPEHKELVARINLYNEYMQDLKNKKVDLHAKDISPEIAGAIKSKLQQVVDRRNITGNVLKALINDNPVYLCPKNAVLVTPEQAALIESDMAAGHVVIINEMKDGEVFWRLVIDNSGKRYRLPDSLEWIILEWADEDIPGNALYDAPNETEYGRIETVRLSGLAPEAKAAEKASFVAMAEDSYIRRCQLTELLEDEAAISEEKSAAKDECNTRFIELDSIYG